MSGQDYMRAKRRVERLKGFYSHLRSYLIVNVILIVVNVIFNPNQWWFYWVTIFWGIGLAFHAAELFLFRGRILGKDWEERKIKEYMEREGHTQPDEKKDA